MTTTFAEPAQPDDNSDQDYLDWLQTTHDREPRADGHLWAIEELSIRHGGDDPAWAVLAARIANGTTRKADG